jgi:hypothetical protein
MMGPKAGATAVGTIKIFEAVARRSGGKARHNMASPTGVSMPPPTPCRTRKATSMLSDVDAPHRPEAVVKTASAKRKTRLVPKRSPIQPDAGMNTARLRR